MACTTTVPLYFTKFIIFWPNFLYENYSTKSTHKHPLMLYQLVITARKSRQYDANRETAKPIDLILQWSCRCFLIADQILPFTLPAPVRSSYVIFNKDSCWPKCAAPTMTLLPVCQQYAVVFFTSIVSLYPSLFLLKAKWAHRWAFIIVKYGAARDGHNGRESTTIFSTFEIRK